jgi:hypothetical protein
MSAVPIITCSLLPAYQDGITIYQGVDIEMYLNSLISVKSLGTQLAAFNGEIVTNATYEYVYDRVMIVAGSLPAGLTTPALPASSSSTLKGPPTTVA